jgi:hypothetical protein
MVLFARRGMARRLPSPLIGMCAAWLIMGCGSLDRGLLQDLFDGDGHGQGGEHHPGGHGGAGGGDGEGPAGQSCGGLIGGDDLYATIASDLSGLDADDAPFTRYLSLANQANADGCGPVLDGARAALDKLVNSVSLDPVLTQPVAVDVNETLYRIDLRDYGWDRPIAVDGTSFSDAWEAIIASSVYAVPYAGDDADDSVADSGTSVPLLFGDAFVATVAKAPLYYALLDIPGDVDDFLSDDLGVDVAAARAAGEVARAGLGGTGIGRSEFLAERFDLQVRTGSVWQIFSGEDGADALTADPSSTPDSDERELVFTLPNGLLGHVLADGNGQRSDDSALTLDTSQNNFRALVGVSYFRLRAQGVTPSDQIRQLALDEADRFTPAELTRIRELYPSAGELARIVAADRAAVESALAGIGIDIDAEPEPISQLFAEFDRDVDLDRAAGDLLISSDGLESNLALLDPALAGLGSGGFVDRDDFSVFYRQSLCILSVVNENQPDPGICQ